MARKRRRQYDRAFKLNAVRVAKSDPNSSVARAARQIGIDRQVLWNWVREVEEKGEDLAFPGPGRQTPAGGFQEVYALVPQARYVSEDVSMLQQEIERLRLELERVRAERDTLQQVMNQLLGQADN